MNTTLRNLISFTLLLAIVLAMACQCFGQPTPTVVGESLQDANGWTQLPTLPAGARRVYVSSSDGNDADDGLSEANAKATVAAGAALIRSGFGDQLLFKRGDTWTGERIDDMVPGASSSEPTVYATYGSGARPKFLATNGFIDTLGNVSDIYVIGLHLEASGRDVGENAFDGIRIASGSGSGLLLEDLLIDGFGINITIQGTSASSTYIYDISVRRCTLVNAWSSSDHSQGFYGSLLDNLVIEDSTLDHNGYTDDWQDTAVMGSGTTAAYTNGDTLTVACVRYGAMTSADLAEALDIELIDTNDASGTVDSVAINGDDLEVRLDLTTGVASNTVAAAIQASNGGADFTCTSSGTANLVAADAGTQANFITGAASADPTIFNHNIYLSGGTNGITFRNNILSRSSSMGTKLNTSGGDITIANNLYVRCGFVGHLGNALNLENATGSNCYVYNNVMIEPEARANNNGLGPVLKNINQGYFRNNILGQKADAEGGGGWALVLSNEENKVGVNNFTMDGNVMFNFRGSVDFDPMTSGDQTSVNNTFSNNIWVSPDSSAIPLLDTYLTGSEMSYSGNQWYSIGNTASEWFTVDGSAISTATWQSTYEANADFTEPTFTDSTRDATSYATAVLLLADYDAFITSLVGQRNGNYSSTLTADAVNDWVRAGFDVSEYTPSSDKKVLILQ